MGNWLQTTIELSGLPDGAIVEEKHPSGDWIVGHLNIDAFRAAGYPAVADALDDIGLADTVVDGYDLNDNSLVAYEEQNYGTGALENVDLPEKLHAAGIAFRFYDDGDGSECMPNEIRWQPGWPEIRRRDAIADGEIAIGRSQANEMLKSSASLDEFARLIAEHLDLDMTSEAGC